MEKTHELVLSPVQQLVPINNKNIVNFEAKIAVKSEGDRPFQALIVNQKQLDSQANPPFRTADKGVIQVTIQETDNVFQAWYLALKGDDGVRVQVKVSLQPVPPKVPGAPPKALSVGDEPEPKDGTKGKKKWNWKIIAIVFIVLAIGGYFLYKYVLNKKSSVAPVALPDIVIPPVPVSTPVSSQSDLLREINDLPDI